MRRAPKPRTFRVVRELGVGWSVVRFIEGDDSGRVICRASQELDAYEIADAMQSAHGGAEGFDPKRDADPGIARFLGGSGGGEA